MMGLTEWAIVERVNKRLLNGSQAPGTELLEPAALLWQVCGFSISSFGVQEYFSPKQPSVVAGSGNSDGSDELPIDVLFGTYQWTASSSMAGPTTIILAGWTGDECRCFSGS